MTSEKWCDHGTKRAACTICLRARVAELEQQLAEALGENEQLREAVKAQHKLSDIAGAGLMADAVKRAKQAEADLLRVRGERDRLRDPTSFDQLVQDVMDNPNAAHAATINKLKHRADAAEADRDRLKATVGEGWSLCVECGPNVCVDEDGCCASCGGSAIGSWLDKYRAAIADPTTGEGLAKRMGASKVRELTNDQKAMIDRAITGVHSPSAVDVFRALAGDDPTPAPEQTEGADD